MTNDEIEEIKNKYHSPQNKERDLNIVGIYYDLFSKEVLYHEKALYLLLTEEKTKGVVLKALLGESAEGAVIEKVVKEEQENGRRADIVIYLKDNTPVILELKTKTNNHNGQLAEYYNRFTDQKYGFYSPLFFYVTPDGREPLEKDGDTRQIINAYKLKKYWDLIKDIEKLNDKGDKKVIIEDYVKTVRALAKEKKDFKTYFEDLVINYWCFFSEIKDFILKMDSQKAVEIHIYYWKEDIRENGKIKTKGYNNSAKESSKITKVDDLNTIIKEIGEKFSDLSGVSVEMKVDDNCKKSTLAIERRWRIDDNENSMFYGIKYQCGEKDNKDKLSRYNRLIKHWVVLGRETNANDPESNENIRKSCQKEKQLHPKIWYIVQYLSDWIMSYCDNNEVYEGRNDAETWAKWIIEDFKLIEDKQTRSL